MDEMSLKTHLDYCQKTDKIIGFEDFGLDEHRTKRPAHDGLVIMVQGIANKWKHPITYFFVKSSCPFVMLKNLLFKSITALNKIGFIPIHVVSDQGANFRGLHRELGITKKKPYFEIELSEVGVRKIFFFYDAPHLIKSTRNCLMNNRISFLSSNEMCTATWGDIEKLYNLDSNSTGLRCAPKLTGDHIYPTKFQRMKVRYATQVFSHTVGAALYTFYSSGKGTESMKSTAEFVIFFNNLFDVFNSSIKTSGNPFTSKFSESQDQLKFLQDSKQTLKSIKIIDSEAQRNLLISQLTISKLQKELREKDIYILVLEKQVRIGSDRLESARSSFEVELKDSLTDGLNTIVSNARKIHKAKDLHGHSG